jgi:hypothetical protein
MGPVVLSFFPGRRSTPVSWGTSQITTTTIIATYKWEKNTATSTLFEENNLNFFMEVPTRHHVKD